MLPIAESTIDQARLDFQSGQLPAGAKPALDVPVSSCNIARDSWLIYRGPISTNAPAKAYQDHVGRPIDPSQIRTYPYGPTC